MRVLKGLILPGSRTRREEKDNTHTNTKWTQRFGVAKRQEHLAAVKRVLRYVAGMVHWGLHYHPGGGKDTAPHLMGYSDSDLAGDVNDRKSTSGLIFFLAGGPIAWQSAKQKVVALSSCEAEYIAAAGAACEGVWLARLLAVSSRPSSRWTTSPPSH